MIYPKFHRILCGGNDMVIIMMIKNSGKLIYIILFFFLSLIPVISMPFISLGAQESQEKREKAQLPLLIEDESLNIDFLNSFDDYLNDNFNFRDELVELNALYLDSVFNTSAENQVIVGNNDWLYFAETIDDYIGENVLSEKEIDNIAKIIELIAEYVESNGAQFLFTIAPNKNSIYPENMPWNYIKNHGDSNADLLGKELDEDIYLDLFQVLKDSEEELYLKKDSHWNNEGAYIAFQNMMTKFGISDLNFEILSYEIRNDFEGDLYGMLYPLGDEFEEQIYYNFNSKFEYVSRFRSMDDLSIDTYCKTGSENVVVFRDSFGNALLEYFGREFENVHFSRIVPYNLDLTNGANYVILEIVERNIPNLLNNAPVMPAIEVVTDIDMQAVEEPTLVIDEKVNYTQIYGYFELNSQVENVYIEIGDKIYEAFPIIEDVLDLGNKQDLIGFSAYFPKEMSFDNVEIKYN